MARKSVHELLHLCHIGTHILFSGTREECEEYCSTSNQSMNSVSINSVETYGEHCYEDGCDFGFANGMDR